MKYIEEISPGDLFIVDNARYVLSSDYKIVSKDKIKKMEECGITVAKSPSIIGKTLFDKLSN